MNFIAQRKLAGKLIQVLQDLHQYILDCSQILDNHDPMVSPLHHAHVSDSFPSNSNSDDDVATLHAFLSNLGCIQDMLRHCEVLAGQQQ